MMEALFDSKVEDLLCGAPSGLNPACSSAIISGKHQSWSPRQLEEVLMVYYQLQHLYNLGKNSVH